MLNEKQIGLLYTARIKHQMVIDSINKILINNSEIKANPSPLQCALKDDVIEKNIDLMGEKLSEINLNFYKFLRAEDDEEELPPLTDAEFKLAADRMAYNGNVEKKSVMELLHGNNFLNANAQQDPAY